MNSSSRPAVVMDCGTGYTKLGYAGNVQVTHFTSLLVPNLAADKEMCVCMYKPVLLFYTVGCFFNVAKLHSSDGRGHERRARASWLGGFGLLCRFAQFCRRGLVAVYLNINTPPIFL